MKIYSESIKSKKANVNNIPNVFAFTFLRNFLTTKEYEETRKEYFINNLNKNQVNKCMNNIKWLFKNYSGLEVITIEKSDGTKSKFIL
ncbi:hypothetical protein [Metaclostridioides mangenotii]|uniref:hypothetical protein n=1 Tax=Metaclostridioides mangenotii TaxID=1540 RepID=UPI000464136E|nr:hypothetical protein [Clostridioides mangenotii]